MTRATRAVGRAARQNQTAGSSHTTGASRPRDPVRDGRDPVEREEEEHAPAGAQPMAVVEQEVHAECYHLASRRRTDRIARFARKGGPRRDASTFDCDARRGRARRGRGRLRGRGGQTARRPRRRARRHSRPPGRAESTCSAWTRSTRRPHMPSGRVTARSWASSSRRRTAARPGRGSCASRDGDFQGLDFVDASTVSPSTSTAASTSRRTGARRGRRSQASSSSSARDSRKRTRTTRN